MPRKEYIAWFDMPTNGKLHGQSVMPGQELIRCKDCMWFSIGKLKSDGTPDMRCKPTWCSLHRTYAKAEFFCSWGNEG